MKPNEITASIGMEQKSTVPKQGSVENYSFKILSRIITVEYKTRTTGVTTHTVIVKALAAYVTRYDGRYHIRDKSELKVKTPHKQLTYGEVVHGLKKFFVEFDHPLLKNETTTIVMEVSWEHHQQAEYPEVSMIVACPTDVLKFLVQPPHNDYIINTKGIVRLNHATHDHISIEDILPTGHSFMWDITQPVLSLYYQIKWKWPN
jgi:hypothetical protein